MNRRERRHAKRRATRAGGAAPGAGGDLLESGLRAHRRGLVADADRLYRRVLAAEPDNPDALHLCGIVAAQDGRHGEAVGLIEQAIAGGGPRPAFLSSLGISLRGLGRTADAVTALRRAIAAQPDFADAHVNLGNALLDGGDFGAAVAAYERAIALSPGQAAAWNNLGSARRGQGRTAAAEAAYRRAVALAPAYGEAWRNLGDTLMSAGDAAGAAGCYERAATLDPTDADARNNLGVALARQDDFAAAAAAFRAAAECRPGFPEALNNLGNARQSLADHEAAIEAFDAAITQRPDYAEAHYNRGTSLKRLGRLDAAARAYDRAIAARPGFAAARNGLGDVRLAEGRVDEAVALFEQALEIDPNLPDAHVNLGLAHQGQGRLGRAVGCYEAALGLRPGLVEALANLAAARLDQGRHTEAEAAYRAAMAANEAEPSVPAASLHSSLLLAMNYNPGHDAAALYAAHRAWDDRHGRPPGRAPRAFPNPPEPDRRLRVGYVSGDFRAHAVALFVLPVIQHHDPAAVDVFCYAQVAQPDAVSGRFRECAAWRGTVGCPDQAVADMIRADRIDILIDLAGHTAANRLPVFAHRPAPVQASWLGYPATTGMAAMGYKLSDARLAPPGTTEQFAECVVHLPGCAACYGPPADAPHVAAPPAAARGRPTFGSFNAVAKITPAVVGLWARVLTAVPEARLVLKARAFADAEARARYGALFADQGIAADRLELRPHVAGAADHLRQYGDIDIALDPFPYGGGTTTFEALWMGVPVVTLAGDRSAARHGASFLAAAGLEALVAADADDYVRLAAGLAADAGRRNDLRATLRARLAASALCDAARFTRELEAIYRHLWRDWCADRPRAQGHTT